MSTSSPKIPPPPPPPAKRPERQETLTAEDIQMGVPDDDAEGMKRGKRGLARPAPSVGLAV